MSKENHQCRKTILSLMIMFSSKLSCAQLILVNGRGKYCTNWLRLISCQEQINRLLVVIHHKTIHELEFSRFRKLNLGCQKTKMGSRTYEHLFSLFIRLCSKLASCNWIPQLFLQLQSFFKKSSYYNSYTWSKKHYTDS